jgi:F-type H+-transporting ATPase subunit b
MHEMLKQLGELLLGSVPTALMLIFLWTMYSLLVHRPLMKVLAERRAKTEGAIEKARADVAAAEARTAEYEQRMREARAAVFKGQEARRKAAMDARAAAVTSARSKALQQIEAAKAAMEQDKVAAQGSLQAESARLATEIIARVLRPVDAQSPMGGAQ